MDPNMRNPHWDHQTKQGPRIVGNTLHPAFLLVEAEAPEQNPSSQQPVDIQVFQAGCHGKSPKP